MPEGITAEALMSNIMETFSDTADVLLWRNKKISASVLTGATIVWVLFEWLNYHLLTLVSFVLVLVMLAQFVWKNASGIMNRYPSKVPRLVLSEDVFVNIGKAVGWEVNCGLGYLQDVACEGNIKQFLMVVGSFWAAAVIGSWCNFLTVIYIGFVAAHTLPILYERYEDQIDAFVYKVLNQLQHNYRKLDARVLSRIPTHGCVNSRPSKYIGDGTPKIWKVSTCKTCKPGGGMWLSEDVIVEILSRLPVKSLLRSKSVCKSWNGIINNPVFISKHHRTISSKESSKLVLVSRRDSITNKRVISSLRNDEYYVLVDQHVPTFLNDMFGHVRLIGPCNGIICLYGFPDSIALWNPSIRDFKILPQSIVPRPHNAKVRGGDIGIGFDSKSRDLKVIQILFCASTDRGLIHQVEIYSSRTDSWRKYEPIVPANIM
ncbi:hypothetical protein OROGR_015445 [Orobanche gracilis]